MADLATRVEELDTLVVREATSELLASTRILQSVRMRHLVLDRPYDWPDVEPEEVYSTRNCRNANTLTSMRLIMPSDRRYHIPRYVTNLVANNCESLKDVTARYRGSEDQPFFDCRVGNPIGSDVVSQCTQLQRLHLDYDPEDHEPGFLSNLKHLRHLTDIALGCYCYRLDHAVRDVLETSSARLHHVKLVTMSYMNIDGALVSLANRHHPWLRSLDVSYDTYDPADADDLLEVVRRCGQLRQLRLSLGNKNPLPTETVEAISNLKQLRVLWCCISFKDFHHIQQLSHLRELRLSTSDTVRINDLGNSRNKLRILHVSARLATARTGNVTVNFTKPHPCLDVISISTDDAGIKGLSKTCPNITALSIRPNDRDMEYLQELSQCSKLRRLTVFDNGRRPFNLRHIRECRQLVELITRSCSRPSPRRAPRDPPHP